MGEVHRSGDAAIELMRTISECSKILPMNPSCAGEKEERASWFLKYAVQSIFDRTRVLTPFTEREIHEIDPPEAFQA